jgi:squalene synthase HpnC
MRVHFRAIYAYCRVADDLGDEVGDRELATRLLTAWRAMLDECYERPEQSRHPVFVALAETVKACGIPKQPFVDLLVAFQQDQTKVRHATWQELVDYSRYSANPVGRLVLHVAGVKDERAMLLSDKVCTALQLANFWQDVSADWERGRVYLPQDAMQRFGVTEQDLAARRATPEFCAMQKELVERTRAMFAEGKAITALAGRELRPTLGLFVAGGEAILDAIAAMGYATAERRPHLGKVVKLRLLARAAWGRVMSWA